MKKELSSSFTFFYKYILSGFTLLALTTGTIFTFVTNGAVGFVFLLISIFGMIWIYFACLRIKKVQIDDEFLYVSNFSKEIKIPIKNIQRVSENVLLSPRTIYIDFKKDTEFGRSIMFIAYTELLLFFSPHPAAEEIRKRLLKLDQQNQKYG